MFSSQKNYLTFFSLFIEYDKPQETTYESPQDILTLTVELLRAYFEDI